MKTILVTGGAGYIGSVVARRLLEKKYNVVILDDLSRGNRNAIPRDADFLQGDIGDPVTVMLLGDSSPIDAVMHFAGYAYVGESVQHPHRYFDNNLERNIRFLHALDDIGVNKMVFSSSCAVYGHPQQSPIMEDEQKNPINPYGLTKRVVEEMLGWYKKSCDWQYVALRYFNAAGAAYGIGEHHNPETHLIPLALHAARDEKPLRLFGMDYPTPDGTCIRDYIHVLDLADAHIAALDYVFSGKSGAFNIGTGVGHSNKEVMKMCEKITGKEMRVELCDRRPGDPPQLIACATKAEQELGWKAQYSFEECIASAWEWHRKHPRGY